jgi:formate dehydrogenase maturation protein FdhE
LQEDLLRFYDGKWVDEKDEVLALAREGGAECGGMPVLSVIKKLDQEMMDFLISAWCVTLWRDIGMRAHHDTPT